MGLIETAPRVFLETSCPIGRMKKFLAPLFQLVAKLNHMKINAVFAMGVANGVLGLAMTAMLARMLGVENYGNYAFLLSFLAIAAIPPSYGLRQTVLRETAYACARSNHTPLSFWITSVALSLAVTLPIAAGGLAWGQTNTIEGLDTISLTWLAVAFVATPLMHIGVGALQGLGKVVQSQAPEYLIRPSTVLALLVLFALVLQYGSLPTSTGLGTYAGATVAAGLYAAGSLFAHHRDRSCGPTAEGATPHWRAVAKTVAGFSVISIAQVTNDNIDTLMLGVLADTKSVGYYRVAVAISTIAAFAIIAVNTVIAPKVATLHVQQEHDELQRLITFSARVTLALSALNWLALFVIGELMIEILFGEEYADAYVPMLIISAGRCFVSALGPMATVLNQTGNERFMLAGLLAALSANALICWMLIPIYGAIGAAVASATAMCLFGIVITTSVRYATGLSVNPFIKSSPGS